MKVYLKYSWKHPMGTEEVELYECKTLKDAITEFHRLVEKTELLIESTKERYGLIWESFYYPYKSISIVNKDGSIYNPSYLWRYEE